MNTNAMNWFLIFVLAAFGLIMGLLSVKGLTQRLEPFLWLLFGLISALILSRHLAYRPFLHAFAIGMLWGILNGLIQFSFFDEYLANNPLSRAGFKRMTFISPKVFVLAAAPVIGAASGLVLGGLTAVLKKIW